MSDLVDSCGPWALVTGASSGIGREYVRQLVARGLDVVAVARRKKRLTSLRDELQRLHPGRTVHPVALDLRREDFWEVLGPALEGREIGLLVNNAGVALPGPLLDHDLTEEIGLLHLNCRASLELTHRLAPPMVDRRRGAIIFLSSTVAMNGGPWIANYCGTKAWNLAIADALAVELAPSGIEVQCCAPGITRTEGLMASLDLDKTPVPPMEVADVVQASLQALGRGPVVVVPGWINKTSTFLSRHILPRRVRHRLMSARIFRPFKD